MRHATTILILSAALLSASSMASQQRATYALKGVRILDVSRGTYSPPAVVLIAGSRIQDIIDEAGFRPQLADSVIDLTGTYLLPGLIDSHVHLTLAGRLPDNAQATVRAGFTTVVDLGARTHNVLRFRDSVNAGLAAGPRILAAGLWVGKQGGVCEFNGIGVAGSPDAFRARVRENIDAGADVIKLCVTGWPADAFANPGSYEIADAVIAASVAEASRAGKRVIAHDLSRSGVAAALRAGINGLAHAAYIDSALAAEMRSRNVFLIPTLTSLTSGDNSAPARALVSAVTLAHRQGVTIVFGTDAGVLPHGSNAAEFATLVSAGLPPIDAIRAATSNAANALGLADSIGAVRARMVADLVAFDADPLRAVAALQKPRFVMARGRIVRHDRR